MLGIEATYDVGKLSTTDQTRTRLETVNLIGTNTVITRQFDIWG